MRTRIAAALLRRPRDGLDFVDVMIDDPEPHEVLVKTESAGLCHSDLHYLTGSLPTPLPCILGHEVAGTVQRVGSEVTSLAPGDRVVATVTPGCGRCRECVRGLPTQCSQAARARMRQRPKVVTTDGAEITLLGDLGGFAEYFLATERALAKVPDTVPMAVACLLGCAVSTGAGAVLHGAKVRAEDTLAVIGCGGVGMAAIQAGRLVGARRVVAVDTAVSKLKLARELGATDSVLADTNPDITIRRLRNLIPGGVSHAIEAVGSAATAELAFGMLAPAGTATVLGLMPPDQSISIPADALIYSDRILKGSYMGANQFVSDVETFADHYASSRLDLDRMVTTVVPFEQINEGFSQLQQPETIRVVLGMAG